jgi:hypothetical protein
MNGSSAKGATHTSLGQRPRKYGSLEKFVETLCLKEESKWKPKALGRKIQRSARFQRAFMEQLAQSLSRWKREPPKRSATGSLRNHQIGAVRPPLLAILSMKISEEPEIWIRLIRKGWRPALNRARL